MGTVHAKEKSPFAGLDLEMDGGAPPSPTQRPKNVSQKFLLNQAQARVDKVNIEGVARTKNDVLEKSVNDLFSATNFEDVLFHADQVRSKLYALGCFSNVGVLVDVSSGPQATADGLEITFQVNELRRITGGVNTTIGNNTGSLVMGMKMPNIAGRGESVHCEYSRGLHKSSNYSLTLSKPYPYLKVEPVISASILQQVGDFIKSGYRQLDRGIMFDVGLKMPAKVYHNLQYECLFRDTSALSRSTAFAIRENSGPVMKSAVRHILSVDRRDDRILPTTGSFLKFTSELSGLGGSMSFLKNELYLQTNYPIIDDCVLQGTFNTGLLNNFHGTNLTEHFYLGGPLSIRGFDLRGIGPQSDGSALGCNFFWATGLHMYTPLPFRPGKGGFGDNFKTHFFLNAGNILPLKTIADVDSNLLTKDIRMTTGIGIALRIGNVARAELNYSFPLRFLPSDVTASGLGFGIGVDFL